MHAHLHPSDIRAQNRSRLVLSLTVTAAFVVVEAAAGVISNSLALLTDAAHNLTDVLALGLSWYALHLTSRPANARQTYGFHRAGILVALVNSTSLALIALGIFYQAYRRLMDPPEVQAGMLIGVGALAFVVNLGTALLIRRGSAGDLNLSSAVAHLTGDVLSTAGAVLAGILILFTGWNWLDPFVSILIGLLILRNAGGILRETVDILLEATPRDVDMDAMVRDLLDVEGVIDVHDLHVWSITRGLRSMSAHILTDDLRISSGAAIQEQINRILVERYNIAHATLQLECSGCEPDLLYCEIDADSEREELQRTGG